jgi:hypothetical protein
VTAPNEREHWLWQSMAFIDFSREQLDAEAVQIAAGTFGGVGLTDLERMSFARYMGLIAQVAALWKKPPRAEGEESAE